MSLIYEFLETLLRPFQFAVKQAVENFISVETADDETTLASMDGSLVSYIRVDGSRQIIGEAEYKQIVTASTLKIGSRFDRPGHALQVYFVRDPERIGKELERLVTPSKTTARNIGLEADDLFEERKRHLKKFISYEECYFVLWTRPSALSKAELDRIRKKTEKVKTGSRHLLRKTHLRVWMRFVHAIKVMCLLYAAPWKKWVLAEN